MGDFMQDQQATVFVIDDDPEVRDGLDRLLRSEGWRVQAFASAQDFLDAAVAQGPGCILLDVDMPGMTGPQLHAHLPETGVGLPVIYLTGRCSVSISVQAMKNGALDFLEKPIDADALLPAIALAVARHRQSREKDERLADIQQRLATLSARERDVFNLVVLGRLNKQIAGDLQIAEKTVKVHRGRVMAKMKVRSVAQLVHLYEQVLSAGAGTG
jgi:FixJ family two-component response regulator